jgi:hypothetical protein
VFLLWNLVLFKMCIVYVCMSWNIKEIIEATCTVQRWKKEDMQFADLVKLLPRPTTAFQYVIPLPFQSVTGVNIVYVGGIQWVRFPTSYKLNNKSLQSLVYSSPLCCKYIILDWVTVKTQLLYCSISYLFIVFVGFIASIAVLAETTCFGPSLGPSSGLARV